MSYIGGGGAAGSGGILLGGSLIGANFNTTSDQVITITSPTTNYNFNAIIAKGASLSLTTATGGIYPSPSKAGAAIVAGTQAYTGLTGAAANNSGSVLSLSLTAGAAITNYN